MIRIEDAKGTCPAEAQQGDTPSFEIDLDIKPGLLWSDGETLDLNDLKYTWEWNIDPAQTGLAAGTTGWDLIDSFEVAADGLKATVHFCTGFAGFYGLLSAPDAAGALHVRRSRSPRRQTLSYPVGTGQRRRPGLGPVQVRQPEPERDRARPQRQLEGRRQARRTPPTSTASSIGSSTAPRTR